MSPPAASPTPAAPAAAVAHLTRPRPDVWVITLDGPPENRLTPAMIMTINRHLDTVEAEWRARNAEDKSLGGAVVLASAQRKFFCNGFVVDILFSPGFFDELANPLFYRLMTFPLITVAALSGHCFAGAMLMAMSCDFRVMTGGKAWMSMNEVLIGLAIHPASTCILKPRIDRRHHRKVVSGHRFTPQEALEARLVDDVVDDSAERAAGEAVPRAVVERAVALAAEHAPKVANGSWGGLKEGMFGFVKEIMVNGKRVSEPADAAARFRERMARREFMSSL